ncbi:MAG: hypothetical protein MSIBF_04955 [Candidatus Altiarchaeales archaeon IMC4]|nr:MAG: hypothetical protein MSIBF_04955 [Candidatus Altiarchaeales archaeon IMC4]
MRLKPGVLLVFVLLALTILVSAQPLPTGGIISIITDIGCKILKLVQAIVGGIILAMLVWSGIKWSASASNPEGRNEAKNAVVWAIIGLTVIIVAGSVLNFVFGSFFTNSAWPACVLYGASPAMDINNVICIFLSIFYGVAAGIAVAVIVLAGIKWSASGDDPSARKSAKGWVINAVVGMIIVGVAANVVNVMVIGSYPGVVTPFTMMCAAGGGPGAVHWGMHAEGAGVGIYRVHGYAKDASSLPNTVQCTITRGAKCIEAYAKNQQCAYVSDVPINDGRRITFKCEFDFDNRDTVECRVRTVENTNADGAYGGPGCADPAKDKWPSGSSTKQTLDCIIGASGTFDYCIGVP